MTFDDVFFVFEAQTIIQICQSVPIFVTSDLI